jgi:hypothetical protein
MRSIIAFICRTLLLTVYVVLGRYEHEATPLDVVERAVVTCMQTCLLGAGWVLFEVCAFVARVLSRRAYAPVSKVLADDDFDEDDLLGPIDRVEHTRDNADIQQPHSPARSAKQVRDSESVFTIDEEHTVADTPPKPADRPITFASSLALGQYVAKVHVIGIVVWTTMLSIDYALSQTSFVFVLGMLLGNVAAVLTGASPHPGLSFALLCVYWGLIYALVLLYILRDGAAALAETETELGMTPTRLQWSQVFVAINVLLSPASCGFSWTYWMDARTLLAHYRTSLYTSVILSVPVLLFVRGAYLSDILARYSAPWLTHVMVTEPVLKFMTIYAMTLSLNAEDVVEMLTVNTCVVGVCYIVFEPHDTPFNVSVGCLIAALLGLHVVRISRRMLFERRTARLKLAVAEPHSQAHKRQPHPEEPEAEDDTRHKTRLDTTRDVYQHDYL